MTEKKSEESDFASAFPNTWQSRPLYIANAMALYISHNVKLPTTMYVNPVTVLAIEPPYIKLKN